MRPRDTRASEARPADAGTASGRGEKRSRAGLSAAALLLKNPDAARRTAVLKANLTLNLQ
jgi:hypothetical protein